MISAPRRDPLFGGLTRPPTYLGLPVEALLIIAGGSVIAFLLTSLADAPTIWQFASLGLGGSLYVATRLICARDLRALRYLFLQVATKGRHRTRRYWLCGSYAPLPCRHR
ncbi:type IV secretory pathway VirB3-like protein [Luteibacter rhizovicinus]|uniref:Type IV secretory pathway VirB3-like protein n=1 Tax=Luteibacter rhizovicinus TaxID=242606 RepID=A0A4R3YQV9_9GAMM|nr:VirB3 family type IV secretion system protein [Luteibacter rhizovicinus]TCV94756.1 type IV secretory pathway VirB3-like protein [Luteibacter rhizovicinus]